MVRTPGFHPGNRGSIPREGAIIKRSSHCDDLFMIWNILGIEPERGSGKTCFPRSGGIGTARFQRESEANEVRFPAQPAKVSVGYEGW